MILPSALPKRVFRSEILPSSAFASAVKSTVYSRSPLAFKVPLVTETLPLSAAFTVVSRPFTVYVVLPSFVSDVTVTLLPAVTFTASLAAVFAKSATLSLPS